MNKTAGLLQWCQRSTSGYEGVDVKNFTTSWKDGKAFCALVHHFKPELINFEKCKTQTQQENLEMAFAAAEKAGAPRMMDVEDFDMDVPDKLSVITCIGVLQQYLDTTPSTEQLHPAKEQKEKVQYTLYSSATHSPPVKSKSPSISNDIQNHSVPQRRSTVASTSDAAKKAQLSLCSSCGKPIIGSVALEVKGKKYHKQCFFCSRCKNVLDEKSFVSIDDANYCLVCGKQVFFENKKKKEEEKMNSSEHPLNSTHDQIQSTPNANNPISSPTNDLEIKKEKKPIQSSGNWRQKSEEAKKLQQEKEEKERKLKEEKIKKMMALRKSAQSQSPDISVLNQSSSNSSTSPVPERQTTTNNLTTSSIKIRNGGNEEDVVKSNDNVPKIGLRTSIGKTTILERKSFENQSSYRNSLTKPSNDNSPSPSSSPNFIDPNDDEWDSGNTIKRRSESPRPILSDAEDEDIAPRSHTVKIDLPKPILATWQFYVVLFTIIGVMTIELYAFFK
uniref:Alpha-actinin n=1 Tax=Entamoeba histolytica TaxID=5759 RepID=A0A060MZY9_ENTHI|nr:hypothetical protein [Entamoeba histolytica]